MKFKKTTSLTADADGNKVLEIRYKAWGEVRATWTNVPVDIDPAYKMPLYQYTGQASYMDDPTTSGVTEGFGLMFYNARWYDPYLNHFTQADTITPRGAQGLDRYAAMNNNPVRYSDSTGHYGEDVHYNLTYNLVYQEAMSTAMDYGYSDHRAMSFAHKLATEVATADLAVDKKVGNHPDISESPIPRPGTYTSCGKGMCMTYTNEQARHWYTTSQSAADLEKAVTTDEFGQAMHAYQDSFSHWQKLGMPDTPGEIWDGHFNNNKYKACEGISQECASKVIDHFDPESNEIDKSMQEGMVTYIDYFIEDVWEQQNER